MHRELSKTVIEAEPNPAHLVLVSLEMRYKKLKAVITQNVDSLHSRAGNSRVIELHGSGQTASCIKCGYQIPYTEVQKMLLRANSPPCCDKCGGLIKPDVILFGEPLPVDVYENAKKEIEKADLLIIIGSSLTVYPAAVLPTLAIRSGARMIIINREPTQYDNMADIVIHVKAGKILPKILDNFENNRKISWKSTD
jgi:NAD-dependent deacetylase